MTGKKMDRYELLNELGSSPLGSLWRARATEGEALIRLVRVRPPATRAEGDRIAEAARLAVGLEHERVASIVEVLSDVAQYGIVHEQAPGELLASVQKQTLVLRRPAPVPVVLRIVTDLAEAFGFAHEQVGELPVAAPYGGVSPDEALVGGDGVTRALDLFAAAAANADTWARLPRRAAYQAPEHFQKRKLEPASDVFSLAAIAWELCLNRALFLTTSLVEVQKRVLAPVKRADSVRLVGADQVPRDVADVLARALRTDPGERYATMAAFAEALRGCAVGVATHADVAEFVQRLGGPRDAAAGAAAESPHPPALDEAGGVVSAGTGARTPQPPKAAAAAAPKETPSPRTTAERSPAPGPASPGAPRERMATEELGDAELDVAGIRTPPPPPGVRPKPTGGADAKLPTRSPRPIEGRPATPAPPKAGPPAAPKPPGKKPPGPPPRLAPTRPRVPAEEPAGADVDIPVDEGEDEAAAAPRAPTPAPAAAEGVGGAEAPVKRPSAPEAGRAELTSTEEEERATEPTLHRAAADVRAAVTAGGPDEDEAVATKPKTGRGAAPAAPKPAAEEPAAPPPGDEALPASAEPAPLGRGDSVGTEWQPRASEPPDSYEPRDSEALKAAATATKETEPAAEGFDAAPSAELDPFAAAAAAPKDKTAQAEHGAAASRDETAAPEAEADRVPGAATVAATALAEPAPAAAETAPSAAPADEKRPAVAAATVLAAVADDVELEVAAARRKRNVRIGLGAGALALVVLVIVVATSGGGSSTDTATTESS
ncbi:MAG: hypothetical protein IT373_27565, partial [Polyangiaceae bacterium]|nr:hypothetical protein [Polyangiaceae bacterium]